MFNEQAKKSMMSIMQNQDAVLAKHGIKMLGSWVDYPAHEIHNVYEAPSMEAFMAMGQEPIFIAWLAFNTVETKVVIGPQQVKALLAMK